jgi:hypothetical protein
VLNPGRALAPELLMPSFNLHGFPFTVDEFLAVFAQYNRTFIVVAMALWLFAVGVLVGAARKPGRLSRVLSVFLAALWLWNAVAYHAIFFTSINSRWCNA